jgi:hypothetical protein
MRLIPQRHAPRVALAATGEEEDLPPVEDGAEHDAQLPDQAVTVLWMDKAANPQTSLALEARQLAATVLWIAAAVYPQDRRRELAITPQVAAGEYP